MNIVVNFLLTMLFMSITVLIFAGLSYLASLCLDKSNGIASDDHIEKIRRKWLYSFSSIITVLGIGGLVLLLYNVNDGLVRKNILGKLIALCIISILYFGLPYYLGYCKRGVKYLLCLLIFQCITIMVTIQYLLTLLAFSIMRLQNIWASNSVAEKFFESFIAVLPLLITIVVTTYIANNIRLYKANKQYKKEIS